MSTRAGQVSHVHEIEIEIEIEGETERERERKRERVNHTALYSTFEHIY